MNFKTQTRLPLVISFKDSLTIKEIASTFYSQKSKWRIMAIVKCVWEYISFLELVLLKSFLVVKRVGWESHKFKKHVRVCSQYQVVNEYIFFAIYHKFTSR